MKSKRGLHSHLSMEEKKPLCESPRIISPHRAADVWWAGAAGDALIANAILMNSNYLIDWFLGMPSWLSEFLAQKLFEGKFGQNVQTEDVRLKKSCRRKYMLLEKQESVLLLVDGQKLLSKATYIQRGLNVIEACSCYIWECSKDD